ncbi:MAG: cell division protein SepF [Clostridia bacterium]|nr:cell division protein SepF [Clostridia bacterium]MBR6754494.1 cell division protein SepF [Clostridia bacterium]
MGIMDRLNDIFKAEEDYDENEEFEGYEEEEEVAVQAPAAPKAAPVSRSTGSISSTALEMKVVKPERFDEVRTIGEHLLARRTVVLNLEETNKETTKRIIDFLCGVVFAIDGQVKKVANATYVVTPKNVDVSGEQPEAAAVEEEQSRPRELFR